MILNSLNLIFIYSSILLRIVRCAHRDFTIQALFFFKYLSFYRMITIDKQIIVRFHEYVQQSNRESI